MACTLMHFANVRLGATFATLGHHGREHRVQVLATLASLADMACLERAGAVLVSGDLFDCAIPSPATLKTVRAAFTRLQHAGIPAVILPGGRDPEMIFDPGWRQEGQDVCPGAWILGPKQPAVRLDALNLMVRFLAFPQPDSGTLPFAAATAETLSVGLAYRPSGAGSLADLAPSFASSPACYVGIGGDTTYAVETVGAVTVCSPGVPEPLEWGQEHGTVALVRIDDDGSVRVERRRTGAHSFARRELAITPDNARLATSIIERQAHPDLALEVVLTGTCPFDVLIDPQAIESELAPSFFHLRVVDRTQLLFTGGGPGAPPPGTVLGNFARVMDGRLRDAPDEEQATHDREAYRLGFNLLQGGSSGR